MKMNLYEKKQDELLKINTIGRDDNRADLYHHPYEPTPYCVLERLAESGFFDRDSTVVDYGCGKGRVGFFLSRETGARTVGIEYDPRIYKDAIENKISADKADKVDFVLISAEDYCLPSEIDRCYFFNPFSVTILRRVMARILESYYLNPREILLFFYYPSDEYMGYLMTVDELEFYDEIDCDDLFEGDNKRERVMVFCLPYYEQE